LTRVPYRYVEDDADTYIDELGEERRTLKIEYKDGLSKPLEDVVDRIRLIGHTLDVCRKEFAWLSQRYEFDLKGFHFEDLEAALFAVEVEKVSGDYGEGEDFGEFFRRQIAPRLRIEDHQSDVSCAMENLSAYTILQLLARNPQAKSLPVIWHFADVEEGGWVDRSEFVGGLASNLRFLVVTEGSSDAKIIKHAFGVLRPHIADFFTFVDMEEGYPFGGAGNLYRFVKGMISISIQNDAIVLYDNDAEGVANYARSCQLNIPENMRVLKLPDQDFFEQFPTIGPSGRHLANINGQAAAIECYLSLSKDALVRWTSYNEGLDAYQGALVGKALVMKAFLNQKERDPQYDYSRIEALLDLIVNSCIEMREATLSDQYES